MIGEWSVLIYHLSLIQAEINDFWGHICCATKPWVCFIRTFLLRSRCEGLHCVINKEVFYKSQVITQIYQKNLISGKNAIFRWKFYCCILRTVIKTNNMKFAKVASVKRPSHHGHLKCFPKFWIVWIQYNDNWFIMFISSSTLELNVI